LARALLHRRSLVAIKDQIVRGASYSAVKRKRQASSQRKETKNHRFDCLQERRSSNGLCQFQVVMIEAFSYCSGMNFNINFSLYEFVWINITDWILLSIALFVLIQNDSVSFILPKQFRYES
jgi:hypothetical protein